MGMAISPISKREWRQNGLKDRQIHQQSKETAHSVFLII